MPAAMNPLTPTELIRTWEAAVAAPPALRGAVLVAAASGRDPAETCDLPLGELSRRLLDLRRAQYGDALAALADCPQCRQPMELHFRASQLQPEARTAAPVVTESHGRHLTLRVPTARDLVEIAVPGLPPVAAGSRLFRRCLVTARDAAGELVSPDQLDSAAEAAAAAALAEADPGADLELALQCPHCRHEWTTSFDASAYLMTEISAEARRLLREVHELASAYGWTESEILALHPARRAAYLELVRG